MIKGLKDEHDFFLFFLLNYLNHGLKDYTDFLYFLLIKIHSVHL